MPTRPVEWPLSAVAVHPDASVIPAASAEEQRGLLADVERRRVLVPLEVTAAGVLLDGRERLKAARRLSLERVPVRIVAPEDELEYMLRAALTRRQLNASQRSALTLELVDYEQLREQARQRQRANLRPAAERAILPAPGERPRDRIAELADVGSRTVQDVITVREHDRALFERVKQGRISASSAAGAVRRALRDAAIPPAAPPPQGPFQLILADPPWQMGSPNSPFAPEQHYPTMTLDEIKALPVPAAEDAVLFLWAVNALLCEALEVIDAWGFCYRSQLVWVKPSIGPGIWLRQRHEPLLLATRGNCGPPPPEQRCDSVIEARRGRHSEKPQEAYARIEQMYPDLSKLELFARGTPKRGWQAWGNEAEPA